MSPSAPEVRPAETLPEKDAAVEGLVQTPWSVNSAFALVIVAWVLALLAGAVVSRLDATGWSPVARTLVAGGAFLALYAALLGIVWGGASSAGERFADSVGLGRSAGLRWYAIALGVALFGWVFSAAFVSALSAIGIDLPSEDLAVFRLLPAGPLGVALTLLLLLVVAPLAEEVVYRGVLLSSLESRWGALAGIVVSSVVFSVAHLSPVGFVPLLVFGALLGWLFVRSRSLRVCVVAHAAYNALGVIAIFASNGSGSL